MKKRYIALFGVILILVLAVGMNPSKEEYVSFSKEQSIQQGKNVIEKGLYSLVVGSAMDITTTADNYLFFTVFRTDFGEGVKYKVLGVFNKFIPIDDNVFETSKDKE